MSSRLPDVLRLYRQCRALPWLSILLDKAIVALFSNCILSLLLLCYILRAVQDFYECWQLSTCVAFGSLNSFPFISPLTPLSAVCSCRVTLTQQFGSAAKRGSADLPLPSPSGLHHSRGHTKWIGKLICQKLGQEPFFSFFVWLILADFLIQLMA